jgi:segment polarity protein dishevelled
VFILGFDLDLNLIINSDMDIIVRAMAEPDSSLDIRDREWLKIPIREAFLGMKEKKIIFKNN